MHIQNKKKSGEKKCGCRKLLFIYVPVSHCCAPIYALPTSYMKAPLATSASLSRRRPPQTGQVTPKELPCVLPYASACVSFRLTPHRSYQTTTRRAQLHHSSQLQPHCIGSKQAHSPILFQLLLQKMHNPPHSVPENFLVLHNFLSASRLHIPRHLPWPIPNHFSRELCICLSWRTFHELCAHTTTWDNTPWAHPLSIYLFSIPMFR